MWQRQTNCFAKQVVNKIEVWMKCGLCDVKELCKLYGRSLPFIYGSMPLACILLCQSVSSLTRGPLPSSLWFAYKLGLSTTMCTTVAKGAVQLYQNNGTDKLVCLLNAFDRISVNKVFQQLLDCRFPAEYLSLLMNSYLDQSIQIKWGSTVSDVSKCVNGIRQGGVISPISFKVYINSLIMRLQSSKAGYRSPLLCH